MRSILNVHVIFLHKQQYLRYGLIFKRKILGHKAGQGQQFDMIGIGLVVV